MNYEIGLLIWRLRKNFIELSRENKIKVQKTNQKKKILHHIILYEFFQKLFLISLSFFKCRFSQILEYL